MLKIVSLGSKIFGYLLCKNNLNEFSLTLSLGTETLHMCTSRFVSSELQYIEIKFEQKLDKTLEAN